MLALLILSIFVEPGLSIPQSEPHLSWESKSASNHEWTSITLEAIEKHFEQLDRALDTTEMCPNYNNLGREDKKLVWGELISSMAFYESGWNPQAQYPEVTMGIDPVTGEPVISEGLMQMSYQDTTWASWCHYNWAADKKLGRKDPHKTILRPKNNLECAVGTLANQIRRDNKIFLEKRAYWAVIKIKNKNNRIREIKGRVAALPLCYIRE